MHASRMINCQKSWRVTGSTPVVGSSSSSTFGWLTSAEARPSFCFMPPESCPARRSSKAGQPDKFQDFQAARQPFRLGQAAHFGKEADVLQHGQVFI